MSRYGDLFRQMAERIDRATEDEFAGAMLLVPPGEGEPLAMLLVDPQQKAEIFWFSAKNRVDTEADIVVSEMQRREAASSSMYGRR